MIGFVAINLTRFNCSNTRFNYYRAADAAVDAGALAMTWTIRVSKKPSKAVPFKWKKTFMAEKHERRTHPHTHTFSYNSVHTYTNLLYTMQTE